MIDLDESHERELFARRARMPAQRAPSVASVLARAAERERQGRGLGGGMGWSRAGAAIAAAAACFALVHGLPGRAAPPTVDATVAPRAVPVAVESGAALACRSPTFSFADPVTPVCDGRDEAHLSAVDTTVASSSLQSPAPSLSCVAE